MTTHPQIDFGEGKGPGKKGPIKGPQKRKPAPPMRPDVADDKRRPIPDPGLVAAAGRIQKERAAAAKRIRKHMADTRKNLEKLRKP